jgi:N utilization substance protein B
MFGALQRPRTLGRAQVTSTPARGKRGPPGRRGRHAARLAAVQALYQMELTGDDSESVVQQFVEHRFSRLEDNEPDESFFAGIVRGVPQHQVEIDRTVQGALNTDWQLKRIDATLRAILRAAAARAVIDEYVEIAHAFFQTDEPGFVNAALDKIARKKRAREFGETPPDDELDF